jgi:hypothetical protein
LTKRTSKAAAIFNLIYGTAEAVPLSKTSKLTHYKESPVCVASVGHGRKIPGEK